MNKIATVEVLQAELRAILAMTEESRPSSSKIASALLELSERLGTPKVAFEEERNFGIDLKHPTYRSPKSVSFKGTLPEAKRKARKLLKEQEEDGWKVTVTTDGQVIYAERQ